jgi:hypothetical protein
MNQGVSHGEWCACNGIWGCVCGQVKLHNYVQLIKGVPTLTGNVITSYFYDIHWNLTSVIDAEEHETTYQYDDMGV